jgi:hypothetical protein
MNLFKNNMGVLITLILVIFLSQSKIFNFLMDTYLGRLILITFISLIAYSNKIIGLLAILFIIIAFNYNDTNVIQSYNFYEGFDTSGNEMLKEVLKKDNLKKDIQKNIVKNPLKNTEITTTTSSIDSSNNSSKINNLEGREGFCMQDRELNILRGKQSNSISVFNNSRSQGDNVLPSEKSIFSDLFASFQ